MVTPWRAVRSGQDSLGQRREPVERSAEAIRRGGAGPRQPALVGQPGPVVGMGNPRPGRVDRLELPPPQVPRRHLPWLGRRPGDPAAFLELHHVVLPDLTPGQRHRENVTGAPDALPGRCAGQVVVAVPARLRRRIRDQLEDPPRPGRDLPGRADHPRRILLSCHALIKGCP